MYIRKWCIVFISLTFLAALVGLCVRTALAQQTEVTITISPSVADTTVRSGDPTSNFGNLTFIEAESTLQFGFIKFDLSSIPSGATVVSAELKLFDTEGQGGNQTISVSRVDTNWDENTLVWNSAITLESPTASLTYNPSDTGYHTWDVTSDVQAFLSGTPNNGWCVKISDGWVTFASKEGTTGELPKLVVTIQTTVTPTATLTPALSQTPRSTQTPEPTSTPTPSQNNWVPYVAVPAAIGGVAAAIYVAKSLITPKPSTSTSMPQTTTTTNPTTTSTASSSSTTKAADLELLKIQLAQKQAYLKTLQTQLATAKAGHPITDQSQLYEMMANIQKQQHDAAQQAAINLSKSTTTTSSSSSSTGSSSTGTGDPFSKTGLTVDLSKMGSIADAAKMQTGTGKLDLFAQKALITKLQGLVSTTKLEIQQLQARIALLQAT
jgi:hypothetical protein